MAERANALGKGVLGYGTGFFFRPGFLCRNMIFVGRGVLFCPDLCRYHEIIRIYIFNCKPWRTARYLISTGPDDACRDALVSHWWPSAMLHRIFRLKIDRGPALIPGFPQTRTSRPHTSSLKIRQRLLPSPTSLNQILLSQDGQTDRKPQTPLSAFRQIPCQSPLSPCCEVAG